MDHDQQYRDSSVTDMAAEVIGVSVLPGVLDLVLHKSLKTSISVTAQLSKMRSSLFGKLEI